MYSLAAMLKRYLPEEAFEQQPSLAGGWTTEGYDAAKALILRIRDCHDSELPVERPHAALIDETGARMREHAAALSLERGWTLAREARRGGGVALAPYARDARSAGDARCVTDGDPFRADHRGRRLSRPWGSRTRIRRAASRRRRPRYDSPSTRAAPRPSRTIALIALCALGAALAYFAYREHAPGHDLRTLAGSARAAAHRAADMMRVLVQRNENRPGRRPKRRPPLPPPQRPGNPPRWRPTARCSALPGSIAPAPVAAEDAARSERSAASSAAPRQVRLCVVATSTPDAASAPATPSVGATRDPSAAPRPQERTAQAPPSPPAARKSAAIAPPKPTPSASQPASRALTSPSTRATVTADAQHRPSPPPRRAHAWWASLVPPAWLRTGNPPDPPGMKAQEPQRQLAMSSTETPSFGIEIRCNQRGAHRSNASAVRSTVDTGGGDASSHRGGSSRRRPARGARSADRARSNCDCDAVAA